MALSGTFQNYPVSSFGLYCEWSGVQSVTGNYTDVTLKVYLSYYTLEVGARSDSTISINGVSETYTAPAIDDYSSGWKKKLLKTKTVRVSHNVDGTKSGDSYSPGTYIKGSFRGGNYQKTKVSNRNQLIIGLVGLVLFFVALVFVAKIFSLLW